MVDIGFSISGLLHVDGETARRLDEDYEQLLEFVRENVNLTISGEFDIDEAEFPYGVD